MADRLSRAFDTWRHEPLTNHVAAILLLSLVSVLRFWKWATFPGLLGDELFYFGAFERIVAGESPFLQSGYLYPAALAYLGAWGLESFGKATVLAFMRSINLIGLAVTIWCSLAWVPWRWRSRLICGILILALSPAVRSSVALWNLSLVVAGMLVGGLLLWPRRPVTAGSLLGSSMALKPLAPVAILALFFHRPLGGGRRHVLAAGLSVALAALLLTSFPGVESLLATPIWHRLARSASLHRYLYLLGWEQGVVVLSAGVALLTVLLVRRRRLGRTHLLVLSIAAAVTALPLVWSHTLIATLPIQVIALIVAFDRHAAAPGSSGSGRNKLRVRYELVLVTLGVLALQLAEGPTGIDDQHLLIQWLGTLPTALAPALLTLYIFKRVETFEPPS